MAARIRGILFDLGDTLLDFGRVDVRAMFEAGGRLAYQYLKDLGQPLPSFEAFHRRQLWAIRWNYLKSRLTRREFNALDLIGRLSISMGHNLTHQQTLDLAWLWYEPLSRTARMEPGLRGLLGRLRDSGLVLGLVSNTFVPGEVIDRHLGQLGLLEFLPVRVYSCDVRYRKPHRNIFLIALGQAKLAPAETIFVGDSLEADIAGANRAGMISVFKAPGHHRSGTSVKPAHRIARLAEVEDIVAKCNQPA